MPAVSAIVPRIPRVLIVEDEPRLRDLLLEEIADMGFPSTTARTGEEATRLMQADPHEIMLLDLRLPVMGGMDLFEHVRATWPRTEVVILTGFGDLDAARRAIHLDVVDFLSKPCRLADLEKALDRARRRIFPEVSTVESPLKPTFEHDSQVSTLKQSEREQIVAALAKYHGNRTAAASALGISRRTLHYRLSQYQKQGYLVE